MKGAIGYFRLDELWLNELTAEDREIIKEIYQPMGMTGLTEGDMRSTSQTVIGLLSSMVGRFARPEHRHIAYKVIRKAEELVDADTDPLDVHFLYGTKIDIVYKDRDSIPDGLDKAIEAREQQIACSPEAAKEFVKQYKERQLPSHRGYEQLAIVREKQGQFDAAIETCERAKSEGWAGDWDKRIKRCKKKQRA